MASYVSSGHKGLMCTSNLVGSTMRFVFLKLWLSCEMEASPNFEALLVKTHNTFGLQ